MGTIGERRSNSRAAVNPAGPAPATTATLFTRTGLATVHDPAIVEVPVLPSPGLGMAQRLEADILRRHDEIQLRITTDAHQPLAGQGAHRR